MHSSFANYFGGVELRTNVEIVVTPTTSSFTIISLMNTVNSPSLFRYLAENVFSALISYPTDCSRVDLRQTDKYDCVGTGAGVFLIQPLTFPRQRSITSKKSLVAKVAGGDDVTTVIIAQ